MQRWLKISESISMGRRKLLGRLAAAGGAVVLSAEAHAQAPGSDKPTTQEKALRFPGDPPENFVVYQFNEADPAYHEHVIFSVGAMLRKYGDNIKIVVTAFGPGIHILLKKPRRPVTTEIREKIASLSHYGVGFHACGNTLTALGLTEKDILPFATYVDVGAADLMELQQKGYSYISW
jgi:intracellular sulfur oxidation DsrE/DsrF family protein